MTTNQWSVSRISSNVNILWNLSHLNLHRKLLFSDRNCEAINFLVFFRHTLSFNDFDVSFVEMYFFKFYLILLPISCSKWKSNKQN